MIIGKKECAKTYVFKVYSAGAHGYYHSPKFFLRKYYGQLYGAYNQKELENLIEIKPEEIIFYKIINGVRHNSEA